MKRQIRIGVFETNSSSTHSLTMCSRDDYEKWEKGEILLNENWHIEKQFVTKEEAAVAEDLGNYYRVPADNRDLNYEKYFTEGSKEAVLQEYNSDNTKRLDIAGIKVKLLSLAYIREELARIGKR